MLRRRHPRYPFSAQISVLNYSWLNVRAFFPLFPLFLFFLILIPNFEYFFFKDFVFLYPLEKLPKKPWVPWFVGKKRANRVFFLFYFLFIFFFICIATTDLFYTRNFDIFTRYAISKIIIIIVVIHELLNGILC